MKKGMRELPRTMSLTMQKLNPHLCVNGQIGIKNICANKHIEPETKRGEKRIKLNTTEQRMLGRLEAMERRGDIHKVRVMPMSLKWGVDDKGHYSTYSPDFSHEDITGKMTLIEVKGGKIWDRDKARFRGCRAEWCDRFGFEMWQWQNREWTRLL